MLKSQGHFYNEYHFSSYVKLSLLNKYYKYNI